MESPGPSRRALFRGQLLSRPVAIINDDCLAKPASSAAPVAMHVRLQPFVSVPASDCRPKPSLLMTPAPDVATASGFARATPSRWAPPATEVRS